MRKVFAKFDVDGNGKIDKTELKQVFESMGKFFPESDIAQMIDSADIDQSGALEYEEFIEVVLGEKTWGCLDNERSTTTSLIEPTFLSLISSWSSSSPFRPIHTRRRQGHQGDCPGRHWGRWNLPSMSAVKIRSVTLTAFPFQCRYLSVGEDYVYA